MAEIAWRELMVRSVVRQSTSCTAKHALYAASLPDLLLERPRFCCRVIQSLRTSRLRTAAGPLHALVQSAAATLGAPP